MYLFASTDPQLIEGEGLAAYPGNTWRTFVQGFRDFPQTMHAVGEVATQLSINAQGSDEIDLKELDLVLKAFRTVICPPLSEDEQYHYDIGVDRAKISNGISL